MGGQMQFNKPLHGLRGVASLMVFIAHITFGYREHFYGGNAGLEVFARYFANLGTFGVELFFVISGFVIVPSCLKYGPAEFFGRRFWRLYPLFALFTIIYFVLNMIVPQDPNRNHVSYLISNLLFMDLFLGTSPLTPNAWSITFEVWYYAATYFLVYSFLKKREDFSPVLAILAVGFGSYMLAVYDITAYFIGGAVLYYINIIRGQNDAQVAGKSWRVFICIVAVGTLATLSNVTPPKTYFEVPGFQITSFLTLLCTLILILFLMREDNIFSRMLVSKALRFFGTISYSLYLVHPYTYILVRQVGYRLKLGAYPWQATFPLYLFANIGLAIIVAWTVHKIVEVGPYKIIYGSRIYRQPDTAMS
jgi:peptidoglycan/LPS O-acetylase OafA/YrhL